MKNQYIRRADGAFTRPDWLYYLNKHAKTIFKVSFLVIVGVGFIVGIVRARAIQDGGTNLDHQSAQVRMAETDEHENDAPCLQVGERHYDCSESLEAVKRFKAWESSQENYPSFKATVTAYNSVEGQTDDSPCISANGWNICEKLKAGINTCAAAMPFGMKLHIEGFGTCIVSDRLAPKYANRVDLHMGGADKIAVARAWGIRRNLTVKILPN